MLEAIETHELIATEFQNDESITIQEVIAASLVWKGDVLAKNGYPDEAVQTYEDVIERFADKRASGRLNRFMIAAFNQIRKLAPQGYKFSKSHLSQFLFEEIRKTQEKSETNEIVDKREEGSHNDTLNLTLEGADPVALFERLKEEGDVQKYAGIAARINKVDSSVQERLFAAIDVLVSEVEAGRAQTIDQILKFAKNEVTADSSGFDKLPEMTEADLREVAKATAANEWKKGLGKSPSKFISEVYKEWLGKKRFMREHIPSTADKFEHIDIPSKKLKEILAAAKKVKAAYATEITETPNGG